MTVGSSPETPIPATTPTPPTPVSSYATTVIAVLGVVVVLWWGRTVLAPLTAGLMLALLVTPVTALLTRWLRVRVLATTLTLMLVMTVVGLAGTAFGDQLARVASRAPDVISLVAQQVTDTEPSGDSLMQRARDAFRELDRAADRFAGVKPLIQTTLAAAQAVVAAAALQRVGAAEAQHGVVAAIGLDELVVALRREAEEAAGDVVAQAVPAVVAVAEGVIALNHGASPVSVPGPMPWRGLTLPPARPAPLFPG